MGDKALDIKLLYIQIKMLEYVLHNNITKKQKINDIIAFKNMAKH